ncbi:MAG: MaoC/PaaZ C-terminal domain-containing protein [Burkholderiales bacterium]
MSSVFDPQRILALPPRITTARHDARDAILYALGVGVGSDDATSAETLRFAYEHELAVLPTMGCVLAWPGFWMREPQYGIDWKRVLHAEESLEVHGPLPVTGEITGTLTVERVFDKGADKGALVYTRRDLRDVATGRLLAVERRALFLRGDGGRGGDTSPSPAPHPVPAHAPDRTIALRTRQDQALLYRLNGDPNPLHVDPAVASAAGFRVPILHGLCTYGVAGRALLHGVCGGDAARFRRMDCRFSAVVEPGDTLVTEIWDEAPGRAAFRTRAQERDTVVLNHGYFEFT